MSTAPPQVAAAVDAAFRAEWGRVLAALIGRLRDWDLAEECTAEAFSQALVAWERDGVPRRPGAWLTTVATNRALDRLRRARRGEELLQVAGHEASTVEPSAGEDEEIADDRLRLLFTCCHPALALQSRVALTLRAFAGLTTAEIARAFLVGEPAMAKRLTRARAKITAARIPYRVPSAAVLPERLGGVLAVIYLLFNEGYSASQGTELVRARLCEEAIRLGAALHELMPGESEAAGLLALMRLLHARRVARIDAGTLRTLEEQDRTRWDHAEIAAAVQLLTRTLPRGAVGPYQLQAAIAACHAEAGDAEDTDWPQIAALYGLLVVVAPTPVVRLNRAVAVAMAGAVERGLALVDELAAAGELTDYHLLHATRADLLRRRGDADGAVRAYRRALTLAPTDAERDFLTRRLTQLGAAVTPPDGRAEDRW